MSDASLGHYAEDLKQTILLEADAEEVGALRPEVFTRHLIDLLIEAGEVEEAVGCHLRTRGVEVHGYGVDDEDTLNLIGAIYTGEVPPRTITRAELDTAFRRLHALWDRCHAAAFHEQLEESSDAYDMALHVHQAAPDIRRIRLVVVTDGRATVDRLPAELSDGIEVRRSVWDIERLHRLDSSGRPQEPIEIDFTDRFGQPLPCLSVPTGAGDYSAYLAVIPGAWLAEIYHEFGARLLELNVRSFLQATGKVNRGIRDTLRDEPARFLAYNNGISATASFVEVAEATGAGAAIARIRDLQIVNGGQTTASVHRAMLTGVDLDRVVVQAKITVLRPELLSEIVPLISRYANSQNKVSDADLSANDPFHIEVEQLSRTVWAPAADDALRQTRWFYERARGQYRVAVLREPTPARQRVWRAAHPPAQRFTKTDLAKFDSAWEQLPHETSRGAQKNFTLFTTRLARDPVTPDIAYFQRLVAKAILWKQTERLITGERFGGYRANLVAYTIAKLSHLTGSRLDLDAIWRRQRLDPRLEEVIVRLSHVAWRVLVSEAPPGANITEWAKSERCWQAMREAAFDRDEVRPFTTAVAAIPTDEPGEESDARLVRLMELGATRLDELGVWARQSRVLKPWQRTLIREVADRLRRDRRPSEKQLQYLDPILDEAAELGFPTA